jgi:hypothetical protein
MALYCPLNPGNFSDVLVPLRISAESYDLLGEITKI